PGSIRMRRCRGCEKVMVRGSRRVYTRRCVCNTGCLAVVVAAAGIYLAVGRPAAGSPGGAGGSAGEDGDGVVPVVTAPAAVVAEAEVVPVREAGARRQQAAVAQAKAEVLRAQARLNEVRAGPRPQEVEMARSAVTVAQVRV